MLNRIILPICFIIFTLSGCIAVPKVPLSKDNYEAIRTIYVQPQIKKPQEMYGFMDGQQYGLIIAAACASANKETRTCLQHLAEQNHIDIRNIVYKQCVNQLSHSNFKVSPRPSETILSLEIARYGLSLPHGFSSEYIPILIVYAKLIRDNKIIWQDSEHVLPLTPGLPKFTHDQIYSEPYNLYLMWDKAAEIVVHRLINDMCQ